MLTDTDSLVYEIETDDVYEDFYENKNLFDLSDYPQDPKFFDLVNKSVISKMKNEFKGKITSEHFRLKQKMYTLIAVDGGEMKKEKGFKKMLQKAWGMKDTLF